MRVPPVHPQQEGGGEWFVLQFCLDCWARLLAGHRLTCACILKFGRTLCTSLKLLRRGSVLIYNSVRVSRQRCCFGLCPPLHCEDWHKVRPWGCRTRDTIPLVVLSQGHQTHLGSMCTVDNINKVCFGHRLPDSIGIISAFSFHMQWLLLLAVRRNFKLPLCKDLFVLLYRRLLTFAYWSSIVAK